MTAAILLNAVLLGVALAMDAFSISIANGLLEPGMSRMKRIGIPGTFAFFQFLMPVVGWFFVRTILELFTAFQRWIPWIALILLCFIGGKMLFEGIQEEIKNRKTAKSGREDAEEKPQETDAAGTQGKTGAGLLLLQGIATSIDALSTGFAFSDYSVWQALVSALIIAAETYLICRAGIGIGIRLGRYGGGKASILGGIILILIGIEIFLKG